MYVFKVILGKHFPAFGLKIVWRFSSWTIWHVKDIVLNPFHITADIICITGKYIFHKNHRFHLASFLKIYGIINIIRLIWNLFIWSNFLININTILWLLDSNNSFINWDIFKEETYVQWVQLISVIPRLWKDTKQNKKNFLT